jgi:hypothetical protein
MDSPRDGYLLPRPLQALARWSLARIVAAAVGDGWAGAEETQHRVLDALDYFARGDYRDDVTTVVLAMKPNGSP